MEERCESCRGPGHGMTAGVGGGGPGRQPIGIPILNQIHRGNTGQNPASLLLTNVRVPATSSSPERELALSISAQLVTMHTLSATHLKAPRLAATPRRLQALATVPRAAAVGEEACELQSLHRIGAPRPRPSLCTRIQAASQQSNDNLYAICAGGPVATRPLLLHAGETTISLPFSNEKAQELQARPCAQAKLPVTCSQRSSRFGLSRGRARMCKHGPAPGR